MEVVKKFIFKNIFLAFFAPTFNSIFSVICFYRKGFNVICEEVGTQRAPKEGLEGPLRASTEARRKGT